MRINWTANATKTSHLSELNRRRVIDALLEADMCSRRDIAARTGLALSTVSTITSDLLESAFIRVAGKRDHTAAGRREELVSRNPRAATTLAVHYTTDACTVGVVDFGLNVIEEFEVDLAAYSPEHIDQAIAATINEVLEAEVPAQRPGGVALSLPNHPVQEQIVTARVAEQLSIPVVGLNNVSAMAVYYNYISDDANRARTFSLVYVGSGIGSGLVINGEVFHGVNGQASDLGHVYIKDSQLLCRCGRTGCVETFASLRAISEQVLSHYRHSERLRGSALVDFLHERLNSGDEFAYSLLDQASADLAKGIRNLASLLDPGRIVVVSRLNRLNPYYEERVRSNFYARSGTPTVPRTSLDFSEYRPEAGIVGAGLFAFRKLLGGVQTV